MNMRSLMPWTRSHRVPSPMVSERDPFLALHREVNRLFDEAFRSLR